MFFRFFMKHLIEVLSETFDPSFFSQIVVLKTAPGKNSTLSGKYFSYFFMKTYVVGTH